MQYWIDQSQSWDRSTTMKEKWNSSFKYLILKSHDIFRKRTFPFIETALDDFWFISKSISFIVVDVYVF